MPQKSRKVKKECFEKNRPIRWGECAYVCAHVCSACVVEEKNWGGNSVILPFEFKSPGGHLDRHFR